MEITILQKGGSINIKEKAPSLKKALVGAGWDVNEQEGGQSFDLDLTAVLVGTDGKAKDVVYYGNLDAKGVHHTGDNITGEGDGDDEQVEVKLEEVDAAVTKVLFLVNIYEAKSKGQNFGMVKSSFVRVADADANQELARHDLQKEYDGKTGVVVAELNRAGDTWEFKAVAEGVDGSIDEILTSKGLK